MYSSDRMQHLHEKHADDLNLLCASKCISTFLIQNRYCITYFGCAQNQFKICINSDCLIESGVSFSRDTCTQEKIFRFG